VVAVDGGTAGSSGSIESGGVTIGGGCTGILTGWWLTGTVQVVVKDGKSVGRILVR
jgi:hypothetical protein